MRTMKVTSKERTQLIDITYEVQKIVDESRTENGLLILYVPHTTAAVTINEGADPNVQKDIEKTLGRLIPKDNNYSHIEGNSDAHIKASLLGASVNILIKEGRLLLGTWQSIFFYEGDGPRTRKVYVEIIPTRGL
ncbi:MAG: YjbQ family protein [Thermoplasmata archaeon]|nr:MAG: YjbQ family protein [Thermoplasmata archaeon]MCD6468912.1 YjbQ family protein [Thermoplasmata archaeon]RLF27395.1 MAG: YjbQ family protein [Thermoplasmata archaeon]